MTGRGNPQPVEIPGYNFGAEVWFWSKVDIAEDDQCWLWAAATHERGYGLVGWNGRTWRANRVAWTLVHGPIPAGLYVLHKCNNPPCCNPFSPDHLYLGTQLDNMRDRKEAGGYDEPNWRNPIDDETKKQIRHLVHERGYRVGFVADVFGIDDRFIHRILRRED